MGNPTGLKGLSRKRSFGVGGIRGEKGGIMGEVGEFAPKYCNPWHTTQDFA